MLPSMAAGLLYGLQDSILGLDPQDCILTADDCRDEERAGMLPSMAAGLLYGFAGLYFEA
jgi:hypothetical protein